MTAGKTNRKNLKSYLSWLEISNNYRGECKSMVLMFCDYSGLSQIGIGTPKAQQAEDQKTDTQAVEEQKEDQSGRDLVE